jgi:uncharacterized protein (DUF302 family)
MSIIWVLLGMALMGLIVWFTMPLLMLVRLKSKLSYDETLTALSETLMKKQDWHVINVNDFQKSTKDFITIERAGSIDICNPRYVSKILADDKNRGVTAFMPLDLGIYEDKKGQIFISRLNVGLVGKMFGGTISKEMGMAGKDLNEVVESVSVK